MKKISPIGIWDYNIDKIDLSDPEVAKWYLKRKIEYNDWSAIDFNLLKKYLPELDIEDGKKELLENFIIWREDS